MAESGTTKSWFTVGIAVATVVPGLFVLLAVPAADPAIKALLYGVAIVGAAFLLSWAAEVAQLDFSQGLALALLALIAILPEYVVDASFAWLAADDPAYAGYAVANMTGANRLLIGIAWPMVIVLGYLRFRRRKVDLEQDHGIELTVLLMATIYVFVIPFKGNLNLVDLVILVSIFGFYIWRIARLPAEAPHLAGPAQTIGAYPPLQRRLIIGAMTVGSAIVILMVAKPFAKALVASGTTLGIDEFLLVQWLAPLASESPEFVIVALFAWRGAATSALGTLVSSKINQWTLLVAMLPLVFSIAKGGITAMPLDERQQSEVFLTAAQSLFAVSLLLDLRLSIFGAALLFVLFMTQLIIPEIRDEMAYLYIVLTVVNLIISRRHLTNAFKWIWVKQRVGNRPAPGGGSG